MRWPSLQFSLATLLALNAAVAVALGWAHSRREAYAVAVGELADRGVYLAAAEQYIESSAWVRSQFWPPPPDSAVIYISRDDSNRLFVGGFETTLAEARRQCESLNVRVQQLGVQRLEFNVNGIPLTTLASLE